MAKPIGPMCNLGCRYCFYLEKDQLYPDGCAPSQSPAHSRPNAKTDPVNNAHPGLLATLGLAEIRANFERLAEKRADGFFKTPLEARLFAEEVLSDPDFLLFDDPERRPDARLLFRWTGRWGLTVLNIVHGEIRSAYALSEAHLWQKIRRAEKEGGHILVPGVRRQDVWTRTAPVSSGTGLVGTAELIIQRAMQKGNAQAAERGAEPQKNDLRVRWGMSPDVLDSFVRQYIEAQDAPEVTFAWQGGEPTLLGVEFFRRAVALQRQYAGGKVIHNAFQTNGVLLNDEWARFFAGHGFLIGLSIDGPEALHDHYRRDKGGHGTFARVMRGLESLRRNRVEFNTLTCVQRHNSTRPLEVYRFLKTMGSGFMQFIPIVERVAPNPDAHGLTLLAPDAPDADVTPWSVRPKDYGSFLTAIFDEWVRNDVGRVFVQLFDITLAAWLGEEPPLCVLGSTCGNALAIEHNGDLYSCDHYVYPSHRLGNILETPLRTLVHSAFQRQFGLDKRDTLPTACRECPVRFACNGECPKHRFAVAPNGERGLNYLCPAYTAFFHHVDGPMRFMANELRMQRPPANVMRWVRAQGPGNAAQDQPRPNDRCPCGSGRKYKKCCGAERTR
jgi:uncharacterized protein